MYVCVTRNLLNDGYFEVLRDTTSDFVKYLFMSFITEVVIIYSNHAGGFHSKIPSMITSYLGNAQQKDIVDLKPQSQPGGI